MKVTALKEVCYDPSVFLNVETVDDAVQIILTPDAGISSHHRWKTEAPFLMEILARHIKAKSLVFDFGCGIGRMAKPLIEMLQCRVVGVDISPNMRGLAASCVESGDFLAMPPEMLDLLGDETFDAALSIWVLQHCLELEADISHITRVLKTGGVLFLLNNLFSRALPSNDGRWLDDGKDVDKMIIAAGFECLERGHLQGAEIAPEWLATQTFWAVYRKL